MESSEMQRLYDAMEHRLKLVKQVSAGIFILE